MALPKSTTYIVMASAFVLMCAFSSPALAVSASDIAQTATTEVNAAKDAGVGIGTALIGVFSVICIILGIAGIVTERKMAGWIALAAGLISGGVAVTLLGIV